ncbi:putative disease resistance protein RGA4 [Fagus crenata]
MELECLSVEPGKEVKAPDRIRHVSFPKYLRNTSWNEDVRNVRSLHTCIGASSDTFTCASSKEHLLFVSKQKSLRRNNTSHVSEHVEDVLDGLQPHSNLKVLRISNYHGSKFPTWIQDLLIQDLVEISLGHCGRCEPLPPLGKLRFLKVLTITGMGGVKYLGNEFHGDSAISFLSLMTFCLEQMPNLEVWRTVDERESYPRLSTLRIFWCPKLVKLPIIPSISSLHIEESNAMLIRLPNLKELTNQLDNLCALKDFHLEYCDKLECLPNELQNLHSLQELCITNCRNLLSFPMNGLRAYLHYGGYKFLDATNSFSLSEGIQHLTALEDLQIGSCLELTSLPEGIQHLTALRSLQIEYCDNLSSLPKQIGSLRSLSSLNILGCFNLMSIPDELQNLTSLKRLEIELCSHLKRRCKKDNGED